MEDRIVVDFNALDRIAKKLNTAGKELDAAMSVLSSCRMTNDGGANLRVNTSCRVTTTGVSAGGATVSQAVRTYMTSINSLSEYSKRLSSAVTTSSSLFNETERNLECDLNVGDSGKTNGEAADLSDSQLKAFINAILGLMDKAKVNKEAGVEKSFISYLDSLVAFFTGDKKGLTGAEDLFDLTNKSIGLWTSFYNYLKNHYKEYFDLENSIFSTNNQKTVAGIGIVSGIFGLISTYCGIADTIKNADGAGPAEIAGEIIGGSGSIVDIWAAIDKYKNIGITTNYGIYTPLTLYTSIAKGYITAISQGFKSYEKYYADGSWDLGDAGKTGIESGIAGLYTMVDVLTFGFISEKTTGVSAEDCSAAIEQWATDVGTRSGIYISSDPALNEKYNNSSWLEKTVITFYAALVS